MNKKTPPKQYPVGAHALAAAQAKAHANLARSIAAGIGDGDNPGEVLAFLMNAAFSVELYFKALMLGARGGVVTSGHELMTLLNEFPPFYRQAFTAFYDAMPQAKTSEVKEIALMLGSVPPTTTPSGSPTYSFATFDDAIKSISNEFVAARYYFEKLNLDDWTIVIYPRHAVEAVLGALDATYTALIEGKFAGL